MMTVDEIKKILKMLTANYGEDFYKGTDVSDVLKLWSVQFANDDPEEVMTAVQNCISTLTYRPKIADIRRRMSKSKIKGQMTPTEAFQLISQAVDDSYDRETSTKSYNKLPPILRKLVGNPSQLVKWSRVSDEAFQTVVMSMIRESYKELAQQEIDFHSLPEPLKKSEAWMNQAPEQVALPEPKPQKNIDEMLDDMDVDAKKYREKYGIVQQNPSSEDKVAAFLQPLTADERKYLEAKLAK